MLLKTKIFFKLILNNLEIKLKVNYMISVQSKIKMKET